MKLYTRKDIRIATNKSESAINYWFFITKTEPTKIKYSFSNNPTYLYSQDIFDSVVYHFKWRNKKHNSVILKEKISKQIFCDLNLNLIIPSKLNFLELNQL